MPLVCLAQSLYVLTAIKILSVPPDVAKQVVNNTAIALMGGIAHWYQLRWDR